MIDPKRFDDADFIVEYFGDSVGDINSMSRKLIDDNVQGVNLLNVVSTLITRIKELTTEDTSSADAKAEVDALNKQREEKEQVQKSIQEQQLANASVNQSGTTLPESKSTNETSNESSSISNQPSTNSTPTTSNESTPKATVDL